MSGIRRSIQTLVAVLAVTAACWESLAVAQDPFGNKMAVPVAPAGGKDDKAESAVIRGDHPVILAIRDSKPTSAAELIQAAEATLDFERPDESKRYLTVLLEKKPATADLATAHRQVGSAVLFRFHQEPNIQPEGALLAKLMLDAAYASIHDKNRIDGLVRQLSVADPLKREHARLDLRDVGVDAAAPLLAVIAQASREPEHRFAQAALIELQTDLLPATIAALDANKPLLREKAIEVVTEIGSREALVRLLRRSLEAGNEGDLARAAVRRLVGGMPSRVEIEMLLERKVEQNLDGVWHGQQNLAGLVTVWYWKKDTDVLASRLLLPRDAALMTAARLAADLVAIAPETPRYRRLALLAELEWRAINRLETAAADPLPPADVAELQETLRDAIKRQRPLAIIGVLRLLAKQGDESLLRTSDGRESLIASLLKHVDRRVRLETCRTIIGWRPTTSFSGASHLTDNLGFFLTSTGTPKVLIADVREDHAQTLVGLLSQAGYEGEAVYSSKRFMEMATSQADYEFAVISDAVNGPRAAEMVTWLRRDYRTHELVVAVTGRDDFRVAMERRLRDEPKVTVVPRLHPDRLIDAVPEYATEVERMKAEREQKAQVLPVRSVPGSQILKIAGLNDRNFVSATGRQAQALSAVGLLAAIFAEKNSPLRADLGRLEPVFVAMVGDASLTTSVAPLLAEVGSPKAQTILIDLASQTTFPLEGRQAAAAAFAQAVQRRGILLTTEQIRQQFDRYNRSATAEAETQEILSGLLDVLESKAKARVSQR